MDYDAINLLVLQPSNIQDTYIINSHHTIYINNTLFRKIKCYPVCDSIHSTAKDYAVKFTAHSIFIYNKTIINCKAKRFICLDWHKTFYEDNSFINYTFISIVENNISTSYVINMLVWI